MLFVDSRVFSDLLHCCRTICKRDNEMSDYQLARQLTQLPPALEAEVLPAGVEAVPDG